MNYRDIKKSEGSLLIESMVGISLVIVGLMGIIGLVIRSFQLNDTVVNRFIAANLAGEGIEVVKNIIDTRIAQKIPWGEIVSTYVPSGTFGVQWGQHGA